MDKLNPKRWLEEVRSLEVMLILLAILFVSTNAISLSLVRAKRLDLAHLWPALVWIALVIPAFILLQNLRPKRDPLIFPVVTLLMGWGILLVQRLAVNFLPRQLLWVFLSLTALIIASIVPSNPQFLRRYRYTWLLGGLILLASTFIFGVNPSGNSSAQFWLRLPFIPIAYFQPSELLKLLLVVFFASYFAERDQLLSTDSQRTLLSSLPYLAPLLLMWGFCMLLLVWQRDLGAATIFFVLFVSLLYLATGEKRYVWGGFILLLGAALFAYFAFDVVTLRVDTWWNPWPESQDRAFQIVQSLHAIAAGGLFGQGIGQGSPGYIPVVHSDFAFAAIAEEWGMIGTFVVVGCFAVLISRGFRLAMSADHPFKRYLAAGITILFLAQTFLIMAGVTKLLPLTGVTLPFVSYGGSSLLVSGLMMGLLIYVSSEANPL